ncbi:hypothetical protein E2R68_02180 [Psychromonas sp. RZ22]|uniref:hypothetical protein n=1 Tax=Psychromonas algarum TaxID=2555643 RepID=UPI001067A36B|nr:hypothetical protein [Psychromonas sp. RZ22]TEW55920.1 hypothetical protein E2R68_02180 [Psychromonas sp. RZ22]
MSEYKRKSNLKDSIISGIVVLAILVAAVVFLINQFSEVDLSKKELEDLRSEIKLAEVDLLEKQDKWELKIIRDTKYIAAQEEELNLAFKEFEVERAAYKEEIEKLKANYNSNTPNVSRKQIEREIRAEFASKGNNRAQINRLNSQNLALKAKNDVLEKEMVEFRKWQKESAKINKAAALAEEKRKAQDEVVKLMDEFTAFDIDLKKPNWCDKEYSERFYQAEDKLNEIKDLVKKHNFGDSYKAFLVDASRSTSNTAPDGWCNGVKM